MENPATNTTTPSYPRRIWVPEPKQRGTFGVISLCFSTLLICTWSSLHFGIPARRYSTIRWLIVRLTWTGLAFYTPELLLFLAIHERIIANILVKRVLEFHKDLAEPGMLASMYHYIRGLADWMNVSTLFPYVVQRLIVTE